MVLFSSDAATRGGSLDLSCKERRPARILRAAGCALGLVLLPLGLAVAPASAAGRAALNARVVAVKVTAVAGVCTTAWR